MQIFDCDNVLADDQWRIPRIDWRESDPFRRYHHYHLASAFDQHGPVVASMKKIGVIDSHIAIFTAMPEFYRTLRLLWLNRNNIPFDTLCMRADGDHRSAVEVKREMLWKLLDAKRLKPAQIVAAYDDREDIVAMYRSQGVNGVLIKIHDTCACTPPEVLIHHERKQK